MAKKLVDVFDKSGGKLFTYAIALESEACLDAEFEEVALIFAESSGLVPADKIVHLRACCDRLSPPEAAATEPAPRRAPHRKGAVLSLIKHRMKKAAEAAAGAHRIRQVS